LLKKVNYNKKYDVGEFVSMIEKALSNPTGKCFVDIMK
jgi:hypothetical protein